MSELDTLRQDLIDEQHALDGIVAVIDASKWATPTPSPGWTIQDQIGHLAFFDGTAALAVTDPDAFANGLTALYESAVNTSVDDYTLGTARAMTPVELIELWRMNRARLAHAAAGLAEDTRVPWYGPSMGAKSFITARLMEVWAHGTDIADALEIRREPTDRLRHIAQLGVITRKWSYSVRGRTAPDADVRVTLNSPSGPTWTWGPEGASDSVTGSAEDFCLVVTQRRHLEDTELVAIGLGREWMLIAQAFAGGPTDPPVARGHRGAR